MWYYALIIAHPPILVNGFIKIYKIKLQPVVIAVFYFFNASFIVSFNAFFVIIV